LVKKPSKIAKFIEYDAKLITEQLGSGDTYDAIEKVVSIVIMEQELIPDSPRYHHRFVFYDPEATVMFSDIIEIHTVELEKLPESTDGTELYDWAKFIDAETEEELKMIGERNPQVQRAVVKLRELSSDERARDMYERREKALRDIDSRERYARAEEREIWQGVVAGKDAEIAGKDAEIAGKDAEIARLRAQLSENK